ncbi:MAG: polymer-forming cytoskeletal protein, partial [Pseudomonadota bacterium]
GRPITRSDVTSSTRVVEGDIVHKTIAIESGAHFEGSVQRQEDPLSGGSKMRPAITHQAEKKADKPAAE